MKKLIRYSMIAFTKVQRQLLSVGTQGTKLSKVLEHDLWWRSLTPTEHQQIGRLIAKYNNFFVNNCGAPVRVKYTYTDINGNGIYR
jgi:hypothetical protein